MTLNDFKLVYITVLFLKLSAITVADYRRLNKYDK